MDALVWGLSFLFDKITARRRLPEAEKNDYELLEAKKETNPYRGVTDTSWMGM
jgi:hypothetical protein